MHSLNSYPINENIIHPSISSYVSNILMIENCHSQSGVGLPLITNGYPAIVFQTTDSGIISCRNEK
ncbi:MAG TPA: hypothetical protein VK518_24420 [Puia sp.]|nr:hypothetical protein [Puia sp.]